ncbi:MAG: response regulator transcription factor, partial [Cobetia crustatorum]
AFHPVMGLTQRELEILSLISSQQSNSDIAQRLMLSQHTVKSHLYNIFRKIRVHNRHQAIEWAHEHLNFYIPQRSSHPET